MGTPQEFELSVSNVERFPKYNQLFLDGKIVADSNGRLRYPHGAPVGKMVLSPKSTKDKPMYRESAAEWFDEDSERAKQFVWPD